MAGNPDDPGAKRLAVAKAGRAFEGTTKGFVCAIFDIGMALSLTQNRRDDRADDRVELRRHEMQLGDARRHGRVDAR